MAVTLQLARVSSETLEESKTSPAALSRIMQSKNKNLDMNWGARDLAVLMKESGQPLNIQEALRQAVEGVHDIDKLISMGDEWVFHDPVLTHLSEVLTFGEWFRFLNVEEVHSVSAVLSEVDVEAMLKIVTPVNQSSFDLMIGFEGWIEYERWPDRCREYFNALQDFYKSAALAGQAIVLWNV